MFTVHIQTREVGRQYSVHVLKQQNLYCRCFVNICLHVEGVICSTGGRWRGEIDEETRGGSSLTFCHESTASSQHMRFFTGYNKHLWKESSGTGKMYFGFLKCVCIWSVVSVFLGRWICTVRLDGHSGRKSLQPMLMACFQSNGVFHFSQVWWQGGVKQYFGDNKHFAHVKYWKYLQHCKWTVVSQIIFDSWSLKFEYTVSHRCMLNGRQSALLVLLPSVLLHESCRTSPLNKHVWLDYFMWLYHTIYNQWPLY